MIYADQLSRAGVPVEFHLYLDAYHGFRLAVQARIRYGRSETAGDALLRFLHG